MIMKPTQTHLRLVAGYIVTLAALLFAPLIIQAQTVTLTNSDAAGTSSYNSAGNWGSGAAPAAGNNYFTSTNGLRTPADANDYVFQGGSLTLQSPAS
jgi:hypothetical protein